MYMSNNKKNKKSSYYNIDSIPANYSGQYTTESLNIRNRSYIPRGEMSLRGENEHERDRYEKEEIIEGRIAPDHENHEGHREGEERRKEEHPNDKEQPHGGEHERKGSILDSLGGIFKRRDDGGGFLKNLFSGKNIKNIFTDLDFEDLILLGVIFFLLRDGAEDDLLIILAIILFTGG